MTRHAPSNVRPGWQEERRLMVEVKAENEKALERFTHDHGATLYRLAFRLAGDEERALQIMTSALASAFKRAAFRREEQELGPWLAGFILRQAMPAPARSGRAGGALTAGAGDGDSRQGRGRRGRGRRGAPSREKAGTAVRGAGQDVSTDPPPVVDWSPLVKDEDSRRDLRQRLQLEATRLPFDLRSAWVLLDAEGRDPDKSAAAMEVDQATALSRLHRARLHLCTALGRAKEPS
jgi:DNA-directed RNA polymerase specialized sigma24 family protein